MFEIDAKSIIINILGINIIFSFLIDPVCVIFLAKEKNKRIL